ncbi:MAG: helix-turn-helix domain-containing protein [Candidatus Limnocylindria bacterium]
MKLYTVEQAARWLGRNPQLVRRWLREGRLRGERFGRAWLLTHDELRRFRRSEPERRIRPRKGEK